MTRAADTAAHEKPAASFSPWFGLGRRRVARRGVRLGRVHADRETRPHNAHHQAAHRPARDHHALAAVAEVFAVVEEHEKRGRGRFSKLRKLRALSLTSSSPLASPPSLQKLEAKRVSQRKGHYKVFSSMFDGNTSDTYMR